MEDKKSCDACMHWVGFNPESFDFCRKHQKVIVKPLIVCDKFFEYGDAIKLIDQRGAK